MYYFMNESKSDVVFVVDGLRVPALRDVLSLKSKVFRTMFTEDYEEKHQKEITIEDTTYKAFVAFIRYITWSQ